MRSAGIKNFKLFEELSGNVLEVPPGDRMAPRLDAGAKPKRAWRGVTVIF